MSEISLKAIEQLLDKKFEEQLKPLDGKADRTAVLVANLVEDFHEVPATLKAIQQTLSSHTTLLDGLATDVKKVLDEKTLAAARFDRLEKWAQLAGEKIGVKLEL